ncbi:hypothetical protein QYE76_065422 [Lolium multiflorum]|uniref:Transposase (putative) gypsy type domain-containing protein n=1 Tax=Lolium multiflorum TaxID=4521 RepID=A0AAD8S8U5_LOLMU|nr:hypothetical protein QYE76_065422 [Lolium multiflorum]
MPPWFTPAYFKKTQASKLGDAQGIPFFIDNIIRFHVGAGIPGVAPHYIPAINLQRASWLLWFDKPWFLSEGKLAAVRIIPSSWGSQRTCELHAINQLTPNSILHISIFITLCECFLGTHPHWGLWKRIFYLRHNNSRNVVYNVGSVCIYVRPDIDYFDVKFPDSVQWWRRRWLYVQDECKNSQEYGIAPFEGAEEILNADPGTQRPAEEKAGYEALMKRIHQLQNTHGEELSAPPSSIFSSPFLKVERWMSKLLSLMTRKNPLVLKVKSQDRRNLRLPLKRRLSQIALNLAAPSLLLSSFLQGTRGREMKSKIPAPPSPLRRLPKKLRLKKREPLTLTTTLAPLAPLKRKEKKKKPRSMPCYAEPKNALMLLRLSLSSARELAKKLKQIPLLLRVSDNLKIGVEGTIALVAESHQNVDWAKVGSPKGVNKEKWKALMKEAKPHSNKILAFLSPKTACRTAKTEAK